MMHRLTLHEHDHGSSVHIIPRGTKVWHGSCSGWPPSRILAAPRGRWFADLDDCVDYCSISLDRGNQGVLKGNRKRVQPIIYQFEFVQNVMLWALDQCYTVDHVYNLASQKFTEEGTQIFGELLEDAFYCVDGDEEPQRMSDRRSDRMLVAYLCLLDEDIPGYACNPLADFYDHQPMHAEFFLCKPGNVLRATGQFVTPTRFEKRLNPYRFRPY